MVLTSFTQFRSRTSNRCWVSHVRTSVPLYVANGNRRTLPVFFQAAPATSILKKNRLVAIDFLRSLSEKSDLSLQETCILTWGQIAR